MKRYSSSLNEYKHGKYVLYKDHLEEVEALKKEIEKLKRSPKVEPSTSSSYHGCSCCQLDYNYSYNGGWG